MKRIIIALVILGGVFGATMAHSAYISAFSRELTALLEEAEGKAEEGDWAEAMALTERAQDKWKDKAVYLHITLRHNDTDEVYAGLREVWEFIECQEGGEYSAANARLITKLELLAEAEELDLKNIL